jgi:hypothetical protein
MENTTNLAAATEAAPQSLQAALNAMDSDGVKYAAIIVSVSGGHNDIRIGLSHAEMRAQARRNIKAYARRMESMGAAVRYSGRSYGPPTLPTKRGGARLRIMGFTVS